MTSRGSMQLRSKLLDRVDKRRVEVLFQQYRAPISGDFKSAVSLGEVLYSYNSIVLGKVALGMN